MSEELNLDELRKIVLQSQEKERSQEPQTKLYEEINPNRGKVKKLNPKYCYEWSSLDTDIQVNRLIEFVNRYSEEHDLSTATAKKVRQLLVNALINENLQVEYDMTVGIITKIPKLYYSKEKGYYLGTYLNDEGKFIFKVSKISKCVDTGEEQKITTEEFTKPNLNFKKLHSKSFKTSQ